MKKIIFSILALGHFISFAQIRIRDVDLKFQHYVLKNGMQVILQPDTSQKEVSVEFWIKAGATDEPKGMFGFAHLFEHATPYGFRKDSVALKLLSTNMTNSNAQTKEDYTRYYVQMKPAGLDIALRYTLERLNADTALITDRLIDWHRKNVLAEMDRQEMHPLYAPTAAAARAIATFGADNPYGHAAYGTAGEVKSFTAAQVKTWYASNFFPENTILFIVGNFNVAETKTTIEKLFSSKVSDKKSKRALSITPKTAGANFTLNTPAAENILTLTWAIPGFASKYDPALYLLAYVVENRLIKDHPVSITKAGSLEPFNLYQHVGQFGVYASFKDVNDSNAVQQYLNKVINDIQKNSVTENELSEAKQKVLDDVFSYMKNLGFEASRTELLGEGLLFANNPRYYMERLEKQSKLNSKDVKKAAAKWLSDRAGRVLLVAVKK